MINLEQVLVYTHTLTNIANLICIDAVETGSPGRLWGRQKKCTSRWEEMEKLPTNDPK